MPKLIQAVRAAIPSSSTVAKGGIMAGLAYALASVAHTYGGVTVPPEFVAGIFGTFIGVAHNLVPPDIQAKVEAFDQMSRAVASALPGSDKPVAE